ncbi:MAG: TIM barrel protein [Saprospiraceae bacterium]
MKLNLHNAMWPGIVGKGQGTEEEAISLQRMIELTCNTRVHGQTFDGIDLILAAPHLNVSSNQDEIVKFADTVLSHNLKIGSVVAPIWPSAGGGSAMGFVDERKKFIAAVRNTCEYCKILNRHGVRSYGIIRIDSADSPASWSKDKAGNTTLIANTFREAAIIAADYDEKLAAEGEICWAGMHSWKDMLDLLEEVGKPEYLGFQADLAHTYLYLRGYNASEHALLTSNYSTEEFWQAYQKMTELLAPWTLDFHIAQSNGTVFGSGLHDITGRHVPVNAPDGKLDIIRCCRYWLLNKEGHLRNGIRHICCDGCMFPNSMLESSDTWTAVLEKMIEVREDLQQLKTFN